MKLDSNGHGFYRVNPTGFADPITITMNLTFAQFLFTLSKMRELPLLILETKGGEDEL